VVFCVFYFTFLDLRSLLLILETKVLKQRVRDYLDPKRGLGHSDTASKQAAKSAEEGKPKFDPPSAPNVTKLNLDGTVCEDCN
jgi:hypothetical protein